MKYLLNIIGNEDRAEANIKPKYQSKFVIKQKQTGKNAVNDIYKMS